MMTLVISSLFGALLLAQAHQVAVRPTAKTSCPSPPMVEAALNERVPSAVVPFDRAFEREALIFNLAQGEQGVVGFALVDAKGRVRLRRRLTEVEGQEDCAALAETAALIVQRFLIELDYQAPPAIEAQAEIQAAPPPPVALDKLDLAAVTGWRPGAPGWGALEVGARVGRRFGADERLRVTLGISIAGGANPVPSGSLYPGTASIRRFPVELGVWWRRPGRRVELELGAGGLFDVTRATAQGDLGQAESRTLWAPGLWGGAALRIPTKSRLFFRVSTAAVAGLVRYDFSYRDPAAATADAQAEGITVFSSPTRRFYARMAVEVGIPLR